MRLHARRGRADDHLVDVDAVGLLKAATSLTPLEYQKQLRLQEARRLMMTDGLAAGSAGFAVGYESPSQFSREYTRLFGASPRRDIARLRTAPTLMAAA